MDFIKTDRRGYKYTIRFILLKQRYGATLVRFSPFSAIFLSLMDCVETILELYRTIMITYQPCSGKKPQIVYALCPKRHSSELDPIELLFRKEHFLLSIFFSVSCSQNNNKAEKNLFILSTFRFRHFNADNSIDSDVNCYYHTNWCSITIEISNSNFLRSKFDSWLLIKKNACNRWITVIAS